MLKNFESLRQTDLRSVESDLSMLLGKVRMIQHLGSIEQVMQLNLVNDVTSVMNKLNSEIKNQEQIRALAFDLANKI